MKKKNNVLHKIGEISILLILLIPVIFFSCNNTSLALENYTKLNAKEGTTFEYYDTNPVKGSFKIDTNIYFGRLNDICKLVSGMGQLDSLVHFMRHNASIEIKIEINNFGISESYSQDYSCQEEIISNYLIKNGVKQNRFLIVQNLGTKPIVLLNDVKNYNLDQQMKLLSLNNRLDIVIL